MPTITERVCGHLFITLWRDLFLSGHMKQSSNPRASCILTILGFLLWHTVNEVDPGDGRQTVTPKQRAMIVAVLMKTL